MDRVHETINAVIAIVRDELNCKVMFEEPVVIKLTPHSIPIHLYGAEACFCNQWDLFLMDSDQKWHKLEVTDQNVNLVANSILQRLKLLKANVEAGK